jgi:RNA polymerase sigma factor (sigma-70 family)
MASSPVSEFLQRLGRSWQLRELEEQADCQLLDRFVGGRDCVALEGLVRRYASTVWAICRRQSLTYHDAEDAFQAVFLVLACKASSLRGDGALAVWLFEVARKTASKTRQRRMNYWTRERQAVDPEVAGEPGEPALQLELRMVLDEEISRMPAKYRMALLLCDLQGLSRSEAAKQLPLPEGTVASRLNRARALLGKRLARRGLTMSALTLGPTLGNTPGSAAPLPAVLSITLQATRVLAAAGSTGAGLSSTSADLANAVVRSMALAKSRMIGLTFLLVGLVPSGGLLAYHVCSAPSSGSDVGQAVLCVPEVPASWPGLAPGAKVGEVRVYKAPGASRTITAVAFAPNGRRGVVCGDDGFVRCYDLVTGNQIWELNTHCQGPGGPRDVAIAGNGQLALVAIQDTTVRVLDMATGRELRQFRGHKARALGVTFSRDSRRALSASGTWDGNAVQDNSVILWDVATGKVIRRFEAHTGWVSTPAFSPDERLILTPSCDRTIRLWDVQTGGLLKTFRGHQGFIRTASFSNDGRFILSGSEDRTIRLWDVATGEELVPRFTGHTWFVEATAFSPDSRNVLSAGKDGTLRWWDVATRKQLLCWTEHRSPVCAIAIFRSGKYALSGGADGLVRLWRLPDPAPSPGL